MNQTPLKVVATVEQNKHPGPNPDCRNIIRANKRRVKSQTPKLSDDEFKRTRSEAETTGKGLVVTFTTGEPMTKPENKQENHVTWKTLIR